MKKNKIAAVVLAAAMSVSVAAVPASAAYYRPNDNTFKNNMKRNFSVSQNSPNQKKYGQFLNGSYRNTHSSISPISVNSWR